MKTLSKNTVCFLLTFSFCAFFSGCSSNPSPSDGQQAVQARINQDAQGRIKLNSFRKTNGQLAEVMGVKVYGLEFEAKIEFTENCKWLVGQVDRRIGFQTSKLPNQSNVLAQFSEDTLNPGSIVKQGQQIMISGVIHFEKKENGWSVDGIDINRSTSLTAASIGNEFADKNEVKVSSNNQSTAQQTGGNQPHAQQASGGQESFEATKTKAEMGDAKTQCYLGFCYAEGKGVTKDYVEAVKWFRKAAEQGFAPAQDNLGTCYTFGNGVPKDYDEAAKWFRKAAEQGIALSQFNLGYCCYVGQGVTQDYGEAAKWFGKAAEQGLAAAQFNLGVAYAKGQGVMQNNQEAYIWLWIAAEQNYQGAASQRDIVASFLSQQEISSAVVKANGRNLAIITKQIQGSISDGPTSKIR